MAPKKRYSFFITDAQAEGLKRLKESEGSSEGELIRQALNDFLRHRGVMKADRKRVVARKRP